MQPRLIDFNFAFQTKTVVTASSSDPEFPSANLKTHFRSKVWRSSGAFVIITGANDKIDFKESGGGSELTATIAAGTYTAAGLAAAIKTAMDAAGASNYTATMSSTTGLWTIASDGIYLSLLWLTGTNAATSVGSSIGFDVTADDTGSVSYVGARIAVHTEESIVWDLVTTEEIDSFVLIFDRMRGCRFTSSAVLKLQANATNVWSSPAVDVTLALDSDYEVVSHFFPSDQSYRFWRLKIVDPANADLFVELGAVVLGRGVTLTQAIANEFTPTIEDRSEYVETSMGHRYGDITALRRRIDVSHVALPTSDIRKLESAYFRNGRGTPVLFAIDPTAEFYDKDQFLFYGFIDSSFAPKHIMGGNFSNSMTILEAM